MKILVFSDSHASLGFMRRCVDVIRPNCIIHLGDYYDDGETIAQENPQVTFYQVPGNCDRYRCPPDAAPVLCIPIFGVRTFMTHGHQHYVKSGIGGLLADARRCGSQLLLYGHTHSRDCHQEKDGLWVLNPGASGYGGSAGIVEIEKEGSIACRILTETDLEDIV